MVSASLLVSAGAAPAAEKSKAPAKPPAKASAKKAEPKTPAKLPRFLELGSTKCVPCKMMMPIVEDLKKTYKGKLEVVFIDVWDKPKEAEKYKVQSIPTQVLFDAKGKEFFRHTGFFPKKDILDVFKRQGIDLNKPAKPKTEKK
ncbi:MAG: thioredoxin family protein [Armatimonadetes bacterium]|nr:thioredoxin family protein [Armatimonadota bacterium]